MAVWNTVPISGIRSGFRIDAEFYRQENLNRDVAITRFPVSSLGSLSVVTDGEHGSVVFQKRGIKYLTAEHVKQGYIDAASARFIGNDVDARNARARVCVGDVLISIKGTLGQVGVADEKVLPANMNRDVAIIKPKRKDYGYYLAAFLRSEYGQYQLAREGSGGVQQMITLSRLRKISIPKVPDDGVADVANIYKRALNGYRAAQDFYSTACAMLSEALKENDLKFDRPLSYTTKYSDVMREGRADADYFQVPYIQLAQQIRKNAAGFVRLMEYCDFLSPNANPEKAPNEEFSYVELADINAGLGVIDACEKYRGGDLPSRARRRVKAGDVLASSVVGSIDKSAIIGKKQEGFIASTGFFHLRPRGVPSEFLLLLMRSTIVQMQLRQQATGGILSGVPGARVRFVIVPKVDNDIQQEIAAKVREAHEKHKESLVLLAAAKARVEELIESAAK